MVLFQKQTMQEKDRFLRKQYNNYLFFFYVLTSLLFYSPTVFCIEIGEGIKEYFNNINNFSSKFIQTSGNSIDQGYLYIKDKRIRLDYNSPKRTIKISRGKGVYINYDLKEEEFFSTKNSIVEFFYNIFLDKSFFETINYKTNKNQIVFNKEIQDGDEKKIVIVLFENEPLILRKIIVQSIDTNISLSLSEHNYENEFEKKFFSFVPIFLND